MESTCEALVRFDGGAQCGLHLGGGDDTTALLHGLFFFSSCFAGSKEAGSRKHKVVQFASAKPEGLPPHLGPILVFSIGSKMSQNHHTKDLMDRGHVCTCASCIVLDAMESISSRR